MSNYYKVFCQIDKKWEYVWSDTEPTECPQSDHIGPNSIDPNSITFIRKKTFKVVRVAKNGDGDYDNISEALLKESGPDMVFLVHPGTYIENNPLILDMGVTVASVGTPGNTRIIAMNSNEDIFRLSSWSKVEGFFLSGVHGPNGRAIYFDGRGIGTFASVEYCVIRGCNTAFETAYGPDTLLAMRNLIVPYFSTARGVYCHSGGKFTGLTIMMTGALSPSNTLANISKGIECTGKGSNVSLTTTTINNCDEGLIINDDGNVEATLLNIGKNKKSIIIGETGENTRLRVSSLHITDSHDYDIDILAKDCDIEIFSGELDQDKINNPNNTKLNAKFYSFKNSKKYQTYTGELRIGSLQDPTLLSIGEGRYDSKNLILLTNDNLEDGNWVDLTKEAKSTNNSTFHFFQNINPGNCCYVGFINNIYGFKINVTKSLIIPTSRNNIITEYWNGNEWKYLHTMQTKAIKPFYINTMSFLSYKEKQHLRFGITSQTEMPNKIINGINRKWIRFRLINEITELPEIEYIKIHTNNTCINKDGFIEFFGESRIEHKLNISLENMNHFNDTTHLGNQPIYLSKNIGILRKNNCFGNNHHSRLSYVNYLPKNLDISFPLKMKLSFLVDNDSEGNIEFIFRIGYTAEDTNLYISENNVNDPNSVLSKKIKYIKENSKFKDTRAEISLDIDNININPEGNSYLMWIGLERDARDINDNDTYNGNVILLQLSVFGIVWNNGAHILGY